jgi:hypothetical protein
MRGRLRHAGCYLDIRSGGVADCARITYKDGVDSRMRESMSPSVLAPPRGALAHDFPGRYAGPGPSERDRKRGAGHENRQACNFRVIRKMRKLYCSRVV